MKKTFLFTAACLALLAACEKPEQQQQEVLDSSAIMDTVVDKGLMYGDNWLERWECRIMVDTLSHSQYHPNPSWVEFSLSRYGADSVFMLSRTMAYPTIRYEPNCIFTLDNEYAWNYLSPFNSMVPNAYSIHQDTLIVTIFEDGVYQLTQSYKIHEYNDTVIDIQALFYETHYFDPESINTYDLTNSGWRERFRIYKQ